MDGDHSDDLTSFSSACKCFAADAAMQVTTGAVSYSAATDAATTRVVGVPPARKA